MQPKNQAKKQSRVRPVTQLETLLKTREKQIQANQTLSHEHIWNHFHEAIGSGGLPEPQAIALAERAVRQVREARPAPTTGRKAPSKAEIQAHLKAVRQAREN